jgi:hypothetical protein
MSGAVTGYAPEYQGFFGDFFNLNFNYSLLYIGVFEIKINFILGYALKI